MAPPWIWWKAVLWMKGLLLSCGAGEFGSVMEGRLSQPEGPPQKVAVKTMKCELSLCPTGLDVCPNIPCTTLRSGMLALVLGF